ncbi:NADH-quinone oxidoreductase subunit M [bacterium]|nr:NADH-quinone oxidoreductase subunit M [bacterium]
MDLVELSQSDILTWIVFLPLAGALALWPAPARGARFIRAFSLGVSLAVFALSVLLLTGFVPGTPNMQFVVHRPWIERYGVSFHLGIDGISLFLVLLTTLLTPVVLLSSWSAVDKRVKAFSALLLVLETGMLGAFVALDMVLFYVFWELMLIPMYLLIGVWGHERRIYAALKFILYTAVGSLLMLVGFLYLFYLGYQTLGYWTTDLLQLYRVGVPVGVQFWLFAAFALAFAIKVPMFPFHTWLPDAHVEAPTAGSVILAGVLLKMGTYGFIRFAMPLFPAASDAFAPLIMTLAVVGIIYGALVAMVQPDLKKLVAYSSVSHLGFVMLGLYALTQTGVTGAVYQMLNHGVSTGALFLIVGILYERRHTREIKEFGGLSSAMPRLAFFFMLATLSSIGLPGLNGFVGEFLILVGTFGSSHPQMVYFAASGVILSAVYMLWMFRRVMFGPLENPANKMLPDLHLREVLVLLAPTLLMFWMGLFPSFFTDRMEASVQYFIQSYNAKLELSRSESPADPLRGVVSFDPAEASR